MCEARLMLALLRDGEETLGYSSKKDFAWAQTEYKRIHDAYVTQTGQTGEWTRDAYHAQFGLGSLIQIPEIMWHQGIDLYSYRGSLMHKAMEFMGYSLLGKVPPNAVGETKKVWYLPCGWHIAHNHYKRRKGLAMPNTEAVAAKNPHDGMTFHWGLGSLTHR